MAEITANVNWLAVGVGTVLAFMLGGLWYSPKLFGAKWMEGVGISEEAGSGQPVPALLAQFVATFLLAWIVGVTAAADALLTIILVALTIMALMGAGGLFSRKSHYAIATETGFVAAMVAIMILVHAAL